MDLQPVLAGGGELRARLRSLDWSQTALGPMESWSPSLRVAINLMLDSPHPICIFWGPEFIQIYNDNYVPILGAKHPSALAGSVRRNFAETWEAISPMFDEVLRTGAAVSLENQAVFMDRRGSLEETYFTYSYTPLRDAHGHIAGIYNIVSETTRQVLGQRRFKHLRELAIRTAPARDPEGVLHAAREVFATMGPDLPFALLYRVEARRARLSLCSGLDAGTRGAPGELGLEAEGGPWPLAEVLRSGEALLVEDVSGRGGVLHAGPWPEPVDRALLLPLSQAGGEPDAVLVVGLSPRLPLDEGYRDFLQLLARQLATDMARARALEQETRRATQLARLDRAKTDFFSNVSHELRTPLTLLLGPTENALASPGRTLGGEELERVHRNGLRLLKLVNSLLDFNRLGAARLQANLEPVDLATLTAGLASAFDSVMASAGLRFVVDCPPLATSIWVDKALWEKIVLNLISNAFKFTLQGQVAVRLRERGERVELTVEDTGTGIPLEEQSRIFERFHRVEGARGRSDEGSGIGLALVRELLALHGGEVSVASTPGEGSTFTVRLPTPAAPPSPARAADEPAPGPASVTSATKGTQAFVHEAKQWLSQSSGVLADGAAPAPPGEALRGHVLLADDNADMRDYVVRLLRGRFTVESVADGETALAAARARPPDVVLSDVMMPGLDGFGLVRALQADPRTRHVPIVLISARAGEEATVDGLAAGVEDYLVKPFGARELLARVESVVRSAQARAESRRLLQEVEATRGRLSGLIENAPAFVCTLNGPQHVFELINPLYLQLVGAGRTLRGLSVAEALPEVVEQGFITLLDTVYRTGEPFFGRELPIQLDRTGDGRREEAFLNFVYQPRRDAHGQVEGIDVFGFEVTEQVLARRRLEALARQQRESEARHRQVVEAAGVGLWEVDGATGDMTADARMAELMGLPAGTVFDTDSVRECVHPQDRERVAHAVGRALAGENGGHYVSVFRTGGRDGMPERWVESRAQRLLGADGQRVSLAGAMLDITERKETELLRARQARLHALSARVGQALARGTTVRGMLQACTVVLVSQLKAAFARIWLLNPAQDVLELEASDGLYTHLDGPHARVPVGQFKIGRIAQERRPYLTNSVQTDAQVSNPEWARREGLVAFAGCPLRVGDKLVGVLALFFYQAMPGDMPDVLNQVADGIALGVERLRAEQALRTRVDFEQKLVGIVSHDLRNPLSAILLGTSLLSRREHLDERTLKSVLRIQSSAERATRMVKDLLDFTQARLGGGLQLEPRPADLHVLTRAVVEEVEMAHPTRQVQLHHEGVGEGTWDADRLGQVVQNLVTNALKYSPEDSLVHILTRAEEGGVSLSVSNRGEPIAEEKLGSIFEPMQRATAEVDKVGRSVGLGLYIVRSIVEAHGGSISVVSTRAAGTTFTVRLPRSRS